MGETMRGAEALGRKAGSLVQLLLGWGFGVTALIMTLGQALTAFSMWAVFCGVLLTALLIPPSRIKLRSLLPFMPKSGVLVAICVVLFLAQVSISSVATVDKVKADEAKQEADLAKRLAETREAKRSEFEAKKTEINIEIDGLLKAGKVDDAMKVINKYAGVATDPTFRRLKAAANYAKAKEQLPNADKLPLADRAKLFRSLADYEGDTYFKSQAEQFEKQVADAESAKAAEAKRQQEVAARATSVKAQFSGWDGSHRAVEQIIKNNMKNPDSYEHVETRFIDNGKGITVFTTVRGTNSFGGVVPSRWIAEVSYEGQVRTINEMR